ncbi:uncharacterized protein BT62DRAFT_922715 [Guyanagaster necrorhizus]|uniref:Uncharacterized protein n=1 Tax=Guyanagaster necrorhizus TaxID=856835 RepID=A0A9P7VJI4_9AGAR|nr:uncharacterized protein BT62DRAFT_922715 [Guyanagaster necrorhizus MCA 3950]KAG7442288.1 hypothetical protein BT62DRAFT_922715 [Guyanagaster necrorhizus MCA 3950]
MARQPRRHPKLKAVPIGLKIPGYLSTYTYGEAVHDLATNIAFGTRPTGEAYTLTHTRARRQVVFFFGAVACSAPMNSNSEWWGSTKLELASLKIREIAAEGCRQGRLDAVRSWRRGGDPPAGDKKRGWWRKVAEWLRTKWCDDGVGNIRGRARGVVVFQTKKEGFADGRPSLP